MSRLKGTIGATIVAAWLATGLSQATLADPSTGVQWLINDPISQFDLGMYRASVTMQDVTAYLGEPGQGKVMPDGTLYRSGWTDYDFAQNRILLASTVSATRDRFHNQDICRAAIDSVRDAVAFMSRVPRDVGDGRDDILRNTVVWWFTGHRGFRRSDRPAGLTAELLDIARIQVTLQRADSAPISCSALLLDSTR